MAKKGKSGKESNKGKSAKTEEGRQAKRKQQEEEGKEKEAGGQGKGKRGKKEVLKSSGLKEARSELEADFCVGRHGQRVAFKRGLFHLHLGRTAAVRSRLVFAFKLTNAAVDVAKMLFRGPADLRGRPNSGTEIL